MDLSLFQSFSPAERIAAIIDIIIVAFLLYHVLMLVRATRGWRVLLGLIVFSLAYFIAYKLSQVFKLKTLELILDRSTLLGPVALVILFLPELRQAVEALTKVGILPESVVGAGHEQNLDRNSLEEIIGAVTEMSKDKVGCIVVIETGANLDEIAASGVLVQSRISSSLLASIFYGQNPLHDGAVIIRGSSIYSAACRLPLSDSKMDRTMHMRHRAALGVTEQNDVVAIVVSEERGSISVAKGGEIRRIATSTELREFLIGEAVIKDGDSQRRRRSDKIARLIGGGK